jgi:hypothetical protein
MSTFFPCITVRFEQMDLSPLSSADALLLRFKGVHDIAHSSTFYFGFNQIVVARFFKY